ncbi:MAG: heme-binding protein [Gammaproteobacteria bacterium]|nr:heme-binding protein [Gammaproteobacteria bacterium]MCW9058960.1 heme-binding protein [Gammaproteobacteria bacterium]
MNRYPALIATLSLLAGGSAAVAAEPDLLPARLISLSLAQEIAAGAVDACREKGYQVSAVVVDRSGYPMVALRDVYASRFTLQIAEEKANAVILSGLSSAEFVANRGDIKDEMNLVDGVLMLAGGLPIRAAGALLGAVGVSGAPGGELDEACARVALDAVEARLEFAD